tara:strand:- start:25 stop:219 length:195 start_codon:yes stop_codon:yes gene_type:complete
LIVIIYIIYIGGEYKVNKKSIDSKKNNITPNFSHEKIKKKITTDWDKVRCGKNFFEKMQNFWAF